MSDDNIAQRVTEALLRYAMRRPNASNEFVELLGELVAGVAELDALLSSIERRLSNLEDKKDADERS